MSFWVSGAVIGAAVIGAYSSNQASKKQADAAKKGIKSTEGLAGQARADAINLFNQGKRSRMLGQGSGFEFTKQNAQRTARPMMLGNMMAQQAVGQGGIQANNAILGLPVDMSFANNPQAIEADYSLIESAQPPAIDQEFLPQEPADPAAEQAAAAEAERMKKEAEAKKRSLYDGSTGGLTMAAFDKRRLNIDNVLGNPLGISEKYNDKINPIKKTKKLLKKLF